MAYTIPWICHFHMEYAYITQKKGNHQRRERKWCETNENCVPIRNTLLGYEERKCFALHNRELFSDVRRCWKLNAMCSRKTVTWEITLKYDRFLIKWIFYRNFIGMIECCSCSRCWRYALCVYAFELFYVCFLLLYSTPFPLLFNILGNSFTSFRFPKRD